MGKKRFHTPADLPHRVREQAGNLKADLAQWRADVRQDPSLLWRTRAFRVLLWLAIGLCLALGIKTLAIAWLPIGDVGGPESAAPLATLYVACISADCHKSYTTQQPLDFNAWPLDCPKCAQRTVYRAKLCRQCAMWYATAPGTRVTCPFCVVPEPEDPELAPEARPGHPDDEEDDW